jgi:exopolysaccharide biosynthesis polyprenyl glycosylphosphotransferase
MADLSRSEPLFHPASDTRDAASGRFAGWVQYEDKSSILLDILTVSGTAVVVCVAVLDITAAGTWKQMWIAAFLIVGYALSIVAHCARFHLYTPERSTSVLQEQRHLVQASVMSGLLPGAFLYALHPRDPKTGLALGTIVLTTLALSCRRLVSRILLHRSLTCGAGTRNVLIVGTGHTAQALRNHLDNMPHLGYVFRGFIEVPGTDSGRARPAGDVLGQLDSIFDAVRRHFIDEIFLAAPCERTDLQRLLVAARDHDVNVRLVLDLCDSLRPNPPMEYLGRFSTVALCSRQMPEARLFLKRLLDLLIASAALIALSPAFPIIAILIKRDSPGAVIHVSERMGKKGRVFHCYKFRTMVQDADNLRSALEARNQRDRILFKLNNDPRITRIGRFLRKYSIDELPQLVNVLRGDMSLVGPRPPLASEVSQYQTHHLRRLAVTPGITGLWQVQARNDPSFHKYVSLDLDYIQNWSIRLDLEIIVRTIGVVMAGTGS